MKRQGVVASRLNNLPLFLTALRAALAPVVVLLALFFPWRPAFAGCLLVALLLRRWHCDVPSIYHAMQLRKTTGS